MWTLPSELSFCFRHTFANCRVGFACTRTSHTLSMLGLVCVPSLHFIKTETKTIFFDECKAIQMWLAKLQPISNSLLRRNAPTSSKQYLRNTALTTTLHRRFSKILFARSSNKIAVIGKRFPLGKDCKSARFCCLAGLLA